MTTPHVPAVASLSLILVVMHSVMISGGLKGDLILRRVKRPIICLLDFPSYMQINRKQGSFITLPRNAGDTNVRRQLRKLCYEKEMGDGPPRDARGT